MSALYRLPGRFRRKGQRCAYRPVLEALEDRHLLSAGYAQVNLASDVPGLARTSDPNLVNPWGIAFSPTGPFWFANNGTGVSDLLDGRGQSLPLTVTVPSAWGSVGAPTGTVFNGGPGFDVWENGLAAPSRFLFASEAGTISGWSAVVDVTHALTVVDNSSSGADYKGLALATLPDGRQLLYAADFSHGTIAVFDQHFKPVVAPGSFNDPNLPNGFAPFNVQNINGWLYVAYAQRGANMTDDVPGVGRGYIDVYNTEGALLRRFASQGALDAPWGLVLAPADFGSFGGDLLVGNNGNGHIDAYDPRTGAFLGAISDSNGTPIAIHDLWALTFGNGHVGGDWDTLFFAAGVGYETHGLFGAIQPPQKWGADTAGPLPFDPSAPGEPGDYPIPPRDGPSLLVNITDRPFPTVDLLPLRESSLALVPTLITPELTTQNGAPALGVVAFVRLSDTAPALASNVAVQVAVLVNGQSAASDGALALGTFLDWPRLLAGSNEAERPGIYLLARDSRSLNLAASNVDVLGVEESDAALDDEPAYEAASLSTQEIEAQSRLESTNEKAAENPDPRPATGRTSLLALLWLVSVPTMWVYCKRRRGSRDSSIAADVEEERCRGALGELPEALS
jgi:uncharacterized protein (TIGR03118 family)